MQVLLFSSVCIKMKFSEHTSLGERFSKWMLLNEGNMLRVVARLKGQPVLDKTSASTCIAPAWGSEKGSRSQETAGLGVFLMLLRLVNLWKGTLLFLWQWNIDYIRPTSLLNWFTSQKKVSGFFLLPRWMMLRFTKHLRERYFRMNVLILNFRK